MTSRACADLKLACCRSLQRLTPMTCLEGVAGGSAAFFLVGLVSAVPLGSGSQDGTSIQTRGNTKFSVAEALYMPICAYISTSSGLPKY